MEFSRKLVSPSNECKKDREISLECPPRVSPPNHPGFTPYRRDTQARPVRVIYNSFQSLYITLTFGPDPVKTEQTEERSSRSVRFWEFRLDLENS